MSASASEIHASGEWMDGATAVSRAVRLLARSGELVVHDLGGGEIARWPLSTIRIDMAHEGSAAHIESEAAPGRLAVTSDVSFVDALRALGAHGDTLPRGRRALVIGLSSAAGVVAIFAALYAVAPWLSQRAAERVPLSVEERLSSQMDQVFASRTCQTEQANQALSLLMSRLDPSHAIAAEVRVTNDPVPNAFTLPGGRILLTRGLIEQAKDADEIAGVLAHELAHVRHRHVLAALIQRTFLGTIWAVTVGDYSGLLVVDPGTVHQLLTLRHSREAEAEADATGMGLLRRAHIATSGLVAFLHRNGGKTSGAVTFLSTHPATEQRLSALRVGTGWGGSPALSDDSFHALQHVCGGSTTTSSLSDLFK